MFYVKRKLAQRKLAQEKQLARQLALTLGFNVGYHSYKIPHCRRGIMKTIQMTLVVQFLVSGLWFLVEVVQFLVSGLWFLVI